MNLASSSLIPARNESRQISLSTFLQAEQSLINPKWFNLRNARLKTGCLREQDDVQFLWNDHGRYKIHRYGRIRGGGQRFLRSGTLRWDGIGNLNGHQHVVEWNLIEVKMGEHFCKRQGCMLSRVDDGRAFVIAPSRGVESTRAGEVISVLASGQAVSDQMNMP